MESRIVCDEPPGSLARGRIPSLEGLRAIAIALVLLAHAIHTRGVPGGDASMP